MTRAGWGLWIALFALGCDCGSGAPPEARHVARETPPEPPPEPAPAAPAPPTGPTPAQIRDAGRWLREARRAAHARDYPTALDRFERILAITPSAPRILCEHGYVLHSAGRNADAARQLDRGLRLFGDEARLPASLHTPLAMCVYNRGLVHQALGAMSEARRVYERSLALRPNDTVRARLAALETSDEPERHIEIAGVAIGDPDSTATLDLPIGCALLARTHDQAALVRVLEEGMGGYDDLSDDEARMRADVSEPEGLLLRDGWQRVLSLSVDDGGNPDRSVSIVLAFERAEGFAIHTIHVGTWGETSEASPASGELLEELEAPRMEGSFLRVSYSARWTGHFHDWLYTGPEVPESDDVTCELDQSSGVSLTEHAILCSLRELSCFDFDLGGQITEPPRSEITCSDDDGNEVPVPPGGPALDGDTMPPPAPRRTVVGLANDRIRITDAEGSREVDLEALDRDEADSTPVCGFPPPTSGTSSG